ncbi:carboxylesterase [Colletotrichum higginsianum]|uniref:Carboxylic ester hydrolase n=2 Tax=Colletotrichum higginsianum TaxID=80884 RepID=H1VVP9_COLHI|nr:Carboxylic ester hydrolase [Colletotrichum higginsianum IMI 349063]OBR05537.1 Carboxylic ester hydrolase [Colletotrichum higginsianum IMI 349063]CCF44309.1 carboxylesterase [Colletotrichum higginsianum]
MGCRHQSSLAQILFSSTFILGAFALPASNAGPTVTIASGVVIGTTTQPAGSTNYANAYLGVPFAKSPPERFSPPEAAPSWSSPLSATAFRPACIQQFTNTGNAQVLQKQYFGNPTGALTEESEDCLYLNVFTPPNASNSSKKAVMFWLFPGNLQFGTASLPIYDGSSLAISQDVVVVTINYRTNIFGFSNSPEVPTGSQNSGFLDQRFALRWVQDNIATFGGDPSRVTIFGESAGGESVKQLLANPPSPLPFSAAIMQSQQSLLVGSGSDSYKKVLKQFACDKAPSPIACLRLLPATDIKAYIESAALVFPPVNGDGTSVSDVRGSITSKKWPKIPVLIGTTLNEARVFLAVENNADGASALDSALSKVGISSTATKNSVLAGYSAKGVKDLYAVADRIITDAVFTCTTSTLSSFLAWNGYTAYRYRFDASFPSTSIFPNAGAYHTSEIPSVFGTYPQYNKFGSATQQQINLSSYMQGVWGSFANNPGNGVGWSKVGGALGFELGLLGAGGSSGVSVAMSLVADYPCALYSGLADIAGLSY